MMVLMAMMALGFASLLACKIIAAPGKPALAKAAAERSKLSVNHITFDQMIDELLE